LRSPSHLLAYSALVIACWALAACTPPGGGPPPPDVAPRRYLALGDSYTIGHAVKGRERWPMQLAARLDEKGVRMAEPEIIAENGWTTANLLAALKRVDPHGPYALVTVLIGANDQFQGATVDEYAVRFHAVLRNAIGLAGGDPKRVIVLSIPDWSVTPFAGSRDRSPIATAIERFNEVNRAKAVRAGARYVDITSESRRAAADPSLLVGDGLHPSAKMYAAWAELVLPEALAALRP